MRLAIWLQTPHGPCESWSATVPTGPPAIPEVCERGDREHKFLREPINWRAATAASTNLNKAPSIVTSASFPMEPPQRPRNIHSRSATAGAAAERVDKVGGHREIGELARLTLRAPVFYLNDSLCPRRLIYGRRLGQSVQDSQPGLGLDAGERR